ncbi:MAG: hypothetical protein J6G98_05490 [Bacilli bacterium]|nr:hypothetical protein [Bacilli bacterium]
MNLIKNMDNELLKKLGIIIGSVIVLIIILLIAIIIFGGRLSYSQIEKRMVSAAEEYYADHKDELPQVNNGVVSISTDKLVEEKYLKELTKLTKNKNDVCSGQVSVTRNDDLLFYSATLNCGDNYETKKLKDVIAANVVTSKDGLYQYNDTYIFRGENVNNYVSFADKTWRILRINSDGSIRMIETTKRQATPWDDRYNSDKQYNIGINDYNVSRIKEYINTNYDEIKKNDKAFIIKQNLCIGKRSKNDTINDGSIECSDVLNDQNVGLIQINEFALASISDKCINPLDPECTNYNYLANIGSLWTQTADRDTSYKAFRFSGSATVTNTVNYYQARMVIHINSQVNYVSGDGTVDNPYKFN